MRQYVEENKSTYWYVFPNTHISNLVLYFLSAAKHVRMNNFLKIRDD
jgi:hypothetical protein